MNFLHENFTENFLIIIGTNLNNEKSQKIVDFNVGTLNLCAFRNTEQH